MKVENSKFSVSPYFGNYYKKNDYGYSNVKMNGLGRDTVNFSSKPTLESLIKTVREGNVLRISFKGTLQNPIQTDTSILQMKVRGVTRHQNGGLGEIVGEDDNILQLAQSNWKDVQEVDFKIFGTKKKGKYIELSDPKYGIIGNVPKEIAGPLIELLQDKEKAEEEAKTRKEAEEAKKKEKPLSWDDEEEDIPFEIPARKDYSFSLSNVIAGTTKGAATIGLRVNLKYTGGDKALQEGTQKVFDELLNSPNKKINDLVMIYQPKTSPEKVLGRMFDIEKLTNNLDATKLNEAINNISQEINDPKNKNILLLGHNKPDGDTLGCVIAMESAIKGAFPDKNVDCAVDDKIPGLFRNKMPGIENVKRPYSPERIKMLENNIKILKSQEKTPIISSQIKLLENELTDLTTPENLFDPNPLEGKEKKKYDLVILMDIPTPKRFTNAFKDYIETAEKVIYIDHHPLRLNEWQEAKETTGVDMDKIHNDKLDLICDSVPSATQLITILCYRAGILGTMMQENFETAKKFVASIITGTSTDTGCFTRTANLLPEHMKVPVNQRPNFFPEGMIKWLIDELETKSNVKSIDKKWLRDKITYDLSDKILSDNSEKEDLSPRDKMLTYSLEKRAIDEELGLGFISANYDQMFEIWEDSVTQDEDFSLLDVQNGFKYSEVMGALKADPTTSSKHEPQDKENPTLRERAQEIYSSPYNDDKIAVLIIQDKKKGSITENSEIAKENGLRLSLRSSDGSDHAELLASLFGGGGHGGAAGGRIDLPNIELDSKIAVKIDGEIMAEPETIYQELKHNYEIMHDSSINPEQKKSMAKKIEIAIAKEETGKTTTETITDIVKEIRKEQTEKKAVEAEKNKTLAKAENHDKSGKSGKHQKGGKHRRTN